CCIKSLHGLKSVPCWTNMALNMRPIGSPSHGSCLDWGGDPKPRFRPKGEVSMYQRFCAFILVTLWMVPAPLFAQQPCPNFTVTVGSDEDRLMLSINGAENPQDQIAALDKFVQEHADSKFITCANEYYASINLKQNNVDKSIELAEKDLAANYQDLNL